MLNLVEIPSFYKKKLPKIQLIFKNALITFLFSCLRLLSISFHPFLPQVNLKT